MCISLQHCDLEDKKGFINVQCYSRKEKEKILIMCNKEHADHKTQPCGISVFSYCYCPGFVVSCFNWKIKSFDCSLPVRRFRTRRIGDTPRVESLIIGLDGITLLNAEML